MEPIRLNTQEAILLLTLIGIGVGLVFGLVPLIFGKIRGKLKLGLIGFFVSIVAGAIWSVLPLIVMIIFVFLIIRNPVASQPAVAVNEPPSETASTDVDSN